MAGLDLLGYADTLAAFDAVKDWAGEAEYVVGTNVQYSVYVEFGTSKMAAQPYLRPAVEDVVNRMGDEIAEDAESAEELVKRLALEIERGAKERAPVDTGNLRASIEAEQV